MSLNWISITGIIFGGLLIIFLIILIILSIFGMEFPLNSKFLVVSLLAFCGAFSAGMIIGDIVIKKHNYFLELG